MGACLNTHTQRLALSLNGEHDLNEAFQRKYDTLE